MRFDRRHYSIGVSLSVAALAANAVWLRAPWLGVPALIVAFAFMGAAVAARVSSDGAQSLLRGALAVVAAWTVAGAGLLFLWRFGVAEQLALAAAFAIAGFFLFAKSPVKIGVPQVTLPRTLGSWLPAFVGLVALIWAATILFTTSSFEAIRSPWEVLSPLFLPLLGVTAFMTVVIAARHDGRGIAAILATAILGLGLVVSAQVYAIGYGFDPFIHEAAMREVATHGLVMPKTPYYLGQYADLVPLATLGGLDLHLLNRFAGPLVGLLALVIAAATVAAVAETPVALAVILAAAAPLGHWIATTPQGVAEAFALLAVALAWAAAKKKDGWTLPFLLALASSAAHPIAGIPALGAVLMMWMVSGQSRKLLAPGSWLVALALVLFPAAAFLAQSGLGAFVMPDGAKARLLALFTAAFGTTTATTFSATRTLLYAGRAAAPFAILALAIAAAWRPRTKSDRALFLSSAATATGGVLLAGAVSLPGVIAYEQAIFPARFLSVAGILLLPLALDAAVRGASCAVRSRIGLLSVSFILSCLLVASVYLAYPRLDPEDRTSGRAVSAATVAAAAFLHDQGIGGVVLADQTLAAADIWRYGFFRYAKGEYWISHPSGALGLYGYYLKATDGSPTRALMTEVMDAYGVNEVTLVLQRYWKNFRTTAQIAQASADDSWSIGDGAVLVFTWRR